MKTVKFLQSFFFFLCIAAVPNLQATNPEISKWIRNISEGEGADTTGFSDYAPEMIVSGNVIHTIWMTNRNWESKQLFYRRSPDGGRTWEPKKLILDSNGLDDYRVIQKLYAFGNYVHIAYVVKDGLVPSDLYYVRSTDGGQTFEAPRLLYSVPQNMTFLRVKGDAGKLTIACVHSCHYCAETQILHLFNSDDNGATITDQVVPYNFNNYWMTDWDLAVKGDNIYFFAYENVGVWYNYDYNLHLFSSNDRGQNFRNRIISIPAQSGNHHPFIPMDGNWGYTPKIYAEDERVWMIWSGWNAENNERVFVRTSMDGGDTFGDVAEISGEIATIAKGHESLVANGRHVYASFLTTGSRIYVAESHDYGLTFDPPYEFTIPDDRTGRNSWGPKLVKNPYDEGAHLFSNGPTVSNLSPYDDVLHTNYYGNQAIRDPRYINAAFSSDGALHIIFQGGGVWRWTGWFTDYDIMYRRIDPNYRQTATTNKAFRYLAIDNPGDGSGYSRFDKMTIPPTNDLDFKEAMTIEVWIKPDADQQFTWITNNNTITWNQGDVGGFILWSDGYQGLLPVTNILTTTGRYPMSSSRKMKLHTWNHLAVTYDKNGGAQNFRLYLNGLLVASTNAQGDIISPHVSWIIGNLKEQYYSYDGQMDELRFWNRALTPQEIQDQRFVKLNGDENGLVAYYNFDEFSPEGQVADLTGNGNTGYLVYQEELVPATIENLNVGFEYVQEGNICYFHQKSEGGETFDWNFGDNMTSTDVNPTKIYGSPGTYQVCLTVTGRENSGTWCEAVDVKGIDHITPAFGGNTGGLTIHIFGGGFSQNSTAILRKTGQSDLPALKNIYDPKGSISAVFDLTDKALGEWDMVIKTGGSEQILPRAFRLVPGEKAKPWVVYAGGGNMRINRWTPQTITIGNSANVDAYGVVLWVAVPNTPDFEIVFLNLNVQKPQLAIDRGWSDLLDSIGLYVVVDSFFGKPSDSRVYSFYFPYLPANSAFNISTRVRMAKPVKEQVQVAVSAPFYASPLSPDVQACIAFAAVKACIKAGIGFIPGAPCITGTLSVISDIADDNPPTPSSFENIDVKSFGWNLGTNLFECASSLIPGGNLVAGVLTIVTSSVEAKQEHDDCLKGFWPSPFSIFQILYYGVTSWDPNEKLGPAGFSEENYIPLTSKMAYQINFENKATASAPAQTVIVTDTLSNSLYDLDNFAFGPVGFGDSTFHPTAASQKFGIETDLRPQKNLILRITGELDTATRVIRWQFISLDPDSRDLVSDPLLGFLPPNVLPPEGEGFVSFTVGVKDVLHGDVIENKASIVFDENVPILTNVFVNSFDTKAPESRLIAEDPVSRDTNFVLDIQGSDDGSGVRLFEIWVSENNSAYVLDRYVSTNTFVFTGAFGSYYRFYSIAVDSIGNREVAPQVADAEVSVISSVRDQRGWEGVRVYPVPSVGTVILEFPLTESRLVSARLYDSRGMEISRLFEGRYAAGNQSKQVFLNVPDGLYFIKITAGDLQSYQKVAVKKSE